MANEIFKCPVCEGRGLVEGGFYFGSPGFDKEQCRSCVGRGVIVYTAQESMPEHTHTFSNPRPLNTVFIPLGDDEC